jgi:hypothetical protein
LEGGHDTAEAHGHLLGYREVALGAGQGQLAREIPIGRDDFLANDGLVLGILGLEIFLQYLVQGLGFLAPVGQDVLVEIRVGEEAVGGFLLEFLDGRESLLAEIDGLRAFGLGGAGDVHVLEEVLEFGGR